MSCNCYILQSRNVYILLTIGAPMVHHLVKERKRENGDKNSLDNAAYREEAVGLSEAFLKQYHSLWLSNTCTIDALFPATYGVHFCHSSFTDREGFEPEIRIAEICELWNAIYLTFVTLSKCSATSSLSRLDSVPWVNLICNMFPTEPFQRLILLNLLNKFYEQISDHSPLSFNPFSHFISENFNKVLCRLNGWPFRKANSWWVRWKCWWMFLRGRLDKLLAIVRVQHCTQFN